jgi:hypothetical protein
MADSTSTRTTLLVSVAVFVGMVGLAWATSSVAARVIAVLAACIALVAIVRNARLLRAHLPSDTP